MTAVAAPVPDAAPQAGPAGRPAPIVTRGLTKRFGAFTAVDGVDLEAEPGEILGVLGPNGAG